MSTLPGGGGSSGGNCEKGQFMERNTSDRGAPSRGPGRIVDKARAFVRKMKEAGLISSRRDGPDHVYFLNAGRFRDLAHFLEKLIHEDVH